MPIISITTNQPLTDHQQEQLLNEVLTATSEALAVDKIKLDVSLQIIPPAASVTCGQYQAPFVRYVVMMLAGRSLQAKQALVKSYAEVAKNVTAAEALDVKTIIQDLQRTDLALGDTLLQ